MPDKVNLTEKLNSFEQLWAPKIVGELNGQYVKVVKFQGEYVWHHHEHEDELFLVLKGKFKILLKNSEIELNEGEFYIVPRGVEHKPVAEKLCHALLFEPVTTLNTGNVQHRYTIEADDLEKL